MCIGESIERWASGSFSQCTQAYETLSEAEAVSVPMTALTVALGACGLYDDFR